MRAKAKAATKSKAISVAKARATTGKAKAKVKAPIQPPIDIKSLYQGFIAEVLNGGQLEQAERYLDPVVVSHNPFPGQQPGIAGFVDALRAFRVAFPDLHACATHYVAEADKVVGRFEVKGTHLGDFMGLAATGKPVHYEEIAIVRFAGSRIVEHWAVADALAIMQQLGKSDNG